VFNTELADALPLTKLDEMIGAIVEGCVLLSAKLSPSLNLPEFETYLASLNVRTDAYK
jgi:hypothetical protein